jgi:alkanesulfonate monooxygenase SsuD/methylene tetrahydromethanopterin reductase-like flavin-dependent oxidoreductase (luciferase family)
VSPDILPEQVRQQAVAGNPGQVAEQITTKVLDAGVDGVVLSPVTQLGYSPGPIAEVGGLLKPLTDG